MHVAPPRGARGLKRARCICHARPVRRAPTRGAWIETKYISVKTTTVCVAPPRGARGLKLRAGLALAVKAGRAPTRGAWIETSGPKELITCTGCRDRKSTRLNSSHVAISYAV